MSRARPLTSTHLCALSGSHSWGHQLTPIHSLSHNQPGDPAKLADVLVAFVEAPNPPVRLPLGSDTVAAIEAKHEADRAILTEWCAVAVSTDFAAE